MYSAERMRVTAISSSARRLQLSPVSGGGLGGRGRFGHCHFGPPRFVNHLLQTEPAS